MLRQKQARTRSQLMRAELGETVDHAVRAAGHAAGGIRETVGPRLGPAADRMRSAAADGWGSTLAALAPLNEAAQIELKEARKQIRRQAKQAQRQAKRANRRWPRMMGLLASGMAVGAIAAYLMRQRRQREWEEYDPTEAMEAPPEAGLTTPPSGVAGERATQRPEAAVEPENRRI